MGLCFKNRALRSVACIVLWNFFLPFSPALLADNILVYGRQSELRDTLTAAYSKAMPQHSIIASDSLPENIDIAVAVGAQALEAFCAANAVTPIVITHVYEKRFATAAEGCTQPVGAVFFDAPLDATVRLANMLFPDDKTAAVTSQPSPIDSQLGDRTDYSTPINGRSIYQSIRYLMATYRDWEVFIVEMDQKVYQGAAYRLAIETLVRSRKAAIVPVESLVRAGAVGGAYYAEEDLVAAIVLSVKRHILDREISQGRPEKLSVAINQTALKTLFGRKVLDAELETIVEALNGR